MGRLRRAWVSAGTVLVLAGAGCGGGSPGAPPVRLDAGPAVAALVDPVHVSVSGLPPAALVTVQARALDRQGQPWVSAAVFRASTTGTLNLATAVPVSGSYQVADAAGLLWSLHPAPGTRAATGFTHLGGGLHRPAAGADRRASPRRGDPAAPLAGHGQRPDGTTGWIRRPAVHLGRGPARRSRRGRARRRGRRL